MLPRKRQLKGGIPPFLLLVLAGSPVLGGQEPSFPIRYVWDFETRGSDGGEVYSQEEVPVLIDERPSQPHWLQLFGREADPKRSDRFPRRPQARLTRKYFHAGNRSLLLETHGDHQLVRSALRKSVPGGARLQLKGWVRAAGLRTGSLRVEVQFYTAGLVLPGSRFSSKPVRGDGDWSPRLQLRTHVPKNADSFDVTIILEGSYQDRPAKAWLDSLSVEVLPACQISWPGRQSLLARRDESLPVEVECYSLAAGTYPVRILLEKEWPPENRLAREIRTFRYVPDMGRPLRLRDDIRDRFLPGQVSPDPGLYRVAVEVLRDSGRILARGESRFAWIHDLEERTGRAGVRCGWVYALKKYLPAQKDGRGLRLPEPKGTVNQILLDFSGLESADPTLPPSALMDSGSLVWTGKLRWSGLDSGQLIKKYLPMVRSWGIVSERPLSSESRSTLGTFRKDFPSLEFGAPAGPDGKIPPWAQFRILEIQAETPISFSPRPSDQAILRFPQGLSEEEKASLIEAVPLLLVREGFKSILIDEPWEALLESSSEKGDLAAPTASLLAWIMISRFLDSNRFLKEYPWDKRGIFLLFEDSEGKRTLVILPRDKKSRISFRLWTGKPLVGWDPLGRPVERIPLDSEGVSEISIGPRPLYLTPFPAARIETVLSLKRETESLRLWPQSQEIVYRMQNATPDTLEALLQLDAENLPPRWRLQGDREPTLVAPSGTATWTWNVKLPAPKPFLQDIPLNFQLRLREGDTTFDYAFRDKVPVRSDLVDISSPALPPESRLLNYKLRNLSAQPLRLHVFSRIFTETSREHSRTWERVALPAGGAEDLVFKLPVPLANLIGRDVWVGFQVGGRGDFSTFIFKILEKDGTIHLVP